MITKKNIDHLPFDSHEYCLIDLIVDLQQGNCEFYPYHELFNYNRITSKKVTEVVLDDAAKESLAKAKTLKQISDITNNIESPEFIYPEGASSIGMSFNNLVWNHDRANISVQTMINGKVKLPTNEYKVKEIDSFIFRNFTLVRDGVANVSIIPVNVYGLDSVVFDKINRKNLFNLIDDQLVLDISSLPVINRSMISNISATELSKIEFDLINLKLYQKYLKHLQSEVEVKGSDFVKTSNVWTPEFSAYLKSVGITEKGGFSPKVETIKSGESYISPVLKIKIEKTSSLPKISSVLTKIEERKPLTIIETLLEKKISEFNKFIFSMAKHGITSNEYYSEVVKFNDTLDLLRREYLVDIAKLKFGIILSGIWFSEFKTTDENELPVKFEDVDVPLKVTFDYKDEIIKK